MKKISIQETLPVSPDYSYETKEDIVLNWLLEVRNYLLVNKIADFGDLIPDKKEISNYLNISTGTIQNAIKYAEDLGFFEARQCIGTTIKDPNQKTGAYKMVSKKDKAFIEIKRFLINEGYEIGEIIPTVFEISGKIKTSTNTIRLALRKLVEDGFLRREKYEKRVVLIINSEIKMTEKEKSTNPEIKNQNLSKILKENIKKFLAANYKTGDKIPTNLEFSKMFNVSIRTINFAIKELNKEKIILSRRGKYGSIYLNEGVKKGEFEKSMFMSKPKTKNDLEKNYSYKFEYAYENIKKFILKNYEAGDKIPSMKEFAQKLNVGVSTIKHAISMLVKEGVLYVQKGKYGGLFIVEMPEKEDSYRWIALNPDIL